MLVYRQHGLRIGFVYLDEEPDEKVKVDRLVFYHRPTPVRHADCEEWRTLVLDLSASLEELLGGFAKDAIYEIRRAENKDKIVCESCDTRNAEEVAAFWEFFEHFASATGLAIPGKWYFDLLCESRLADLSLAKTPGGEVLAYHAHCRGRDRVLLNIVCTLHKSAADGAKRQLIGRANRLLFRFDILRFKEQGFRTYDFGGWYPGQTDAHLLAINKFKEQFGGRVATTYVCDQGRTLKGKIALWVRRRLLAWRETRGAKERG